MKTFTLALGLIFVSASAFAGGYDPTPRICKDGSKARRFADFQTCPEDKKAECRDGDYKKNEGGFAGGCSCMGGQWACDRGGMPRPDRDGGGDEGVHDHDDDGAGEND